MSATRPHALLAHYLRPHAARVVAMGSLLLLGIAFQLMSPQVIRRFLDAATTGAERSKLTQAGLLFLGLALLQQVAQIATNYAAADVGWRATNALRYDLTAHCLALNLDFHHDRSPGELISRVDGDVGLLAEFFSRLVVAVVGNGLLILGILVLLWREGWPFGTIGLGYALALAGLLRVARDRIVRANVLSQQNSAEMLGFLEESVLALEDVRGVGAESFVLNHHATLARRYLQSHRAIAMLNEGVFSLSFLSYALALTLTLAAGVLLFRQGTITIGGLFLVAYYVDKLETPLNEVRRQSSRFYESLAAIGRVAELFAYRPPDLSRAIVQPVAGPLSVRFTDVHFAYRDQAVLKGVSFALPAGGSLGIAGRTGSGKTTLVRLLFGLWSPDAGTIELGGTDLERLDRGALRRRVGLVTQDVQLFAGTVRENLTLFDAGIADARLVQALRQLNLWEWVSGLPGGLDTLLGPDGHGLSAGEAQLMAMARVLLKEPGLVVLDEASSRLDPATERCLERALDYLLVGRTVIIVAHRLSTLRRVTDLLLLADGHIVESGRREELAQDSDSRFHRLLRTGLELEAALESAGSEAADSGYHGSTH